MPSTSLPTLDDLATDSTRALKLSVEELVALTVRCAAAQSALSAALIAGTGSPDTRDSGQTDGNDRLLSVNEAARLLSVSKDWLYRRASQLPFTVRLGFHLRFSARGIARYIRARAR